MIQTFFPVDAVIVFPHRTGDDVIHAVHCDDVRENIGNRPDLVYGFIIVPAESECVAQVVSADAYIEYLVLYLVQFFFQRI